MDYALKNLVKLIYLYRCCLKIIKNESELGDIILHYKKCNLEYIYNIEYDWSYPLNSAIVKPVYIYLVQNTNLRLKTFPSVQYTYMYMYLRKKSENKNIVIGKSEKKSNREGSHLICYDRKMCHRCYSHI